MSQLSPVKNIKTKVKICGLKTIADVEACLHPNADLQSGVVKNDDFIGAEFIGLVFFPKSPRHLEIDQAQKLANYARGKTNVVALLVNPDNALVTQISTEIKPDYIQLHGRESLERVAEIKALCDCKIIKAIAVSTAADFQSIPDYEKLVDLILLDAKPIAGKTELPGGNGLTFDWALLENQSLRRPFMLAGGLTPQNISRAIHLTQAPIIDVSSGIEASAGIKDHRKIQDFLALAHQQNLT